VVIVTDDESELSDTSFDSMFKALDPSYADYVFHAIAVPDDPEAACDNGGACCELGEQQGVVYQALVGATGGVFGNLCLQDFQGVFEELAKSVEQGSSLSCEWTIPPAPAGMPFDPDKVNVEFSDGMGNTLQFGRVDSEAECAGVADGWYYDDPANPTKIVACSQTCDKIRDVEGGSITIKFGCATQPAG
jgi:hypothetical protein